MISQAMAIEEKSIPTPQQGIQPPQQGTQLPQQYVRPYGQAFALTKNIVCNDSKVIYNILKNEPDPQIPIFFGLIKNEYGVATMMVQIFIDKNDDKFSIIESSAQGISCAISGGTDFDILPHMHSGEFQKGTGQEINKEIYKLPQEIRMQNK